MKSTNRILAFVALFLASLALVAGEGAQNVRFNQKEFAYKIQNELDHVDPQELAGWISEKREGFRIIDLRSAGEFARYHIPGAENISLTDLMEKKFKKSETLVLYSEGGVHSAQAMFLLWTKGYSNVFFLKGGVAAWEEDVLHKRARSSGDDHSRPADTMKNIPPKKPALKEEEKFRREC